MADLKPPTAPEDQEIDPKEDKLSAFSLRLKTIGKRADFQRASRAQRIATTGFVLQMRERRRNETEDAQTIRVGFTCSKKVGNAVARNRAKRRLREIARLTLGPLARPGTDYVLIGRREKTANLPFATLQSDLTRAVNKLHIPKR